MDPTRQQAEMLKLAGDRESFVGAARAGTGKTTALTMMAHAVHKLQPKATGCVITYNKAPADELNQSGRLPTGFQARTMHSLAYASIGSRYAHRMGRGGGANTIKPWHVGSHLGLPKEFGTAMSMAGAGGNTIGRTTLTRDSLVACVKSTIARYCSTVDLEFLPKHVVLPEAVDAADNPKLVELIRHTASRAWHMDCINPHGQLPYSMDWYLGEYLRMIVHCETPMGFDCIYIDEGQDSTEAVKGAFLTQLRLGAHGVVIGDPYQAIYGWRGARDIMSDLLGDGLPELLLTHSFRFGQAIADEGCKWLTLAGGEADLVGRPDINSTLGAVDPSQPYAVLCRTNAGVAAEVLAAHATGRRVRVEGNISNVVGLLKSMLKLRGGKRSDHPLLAVFEDWDTLAEYVGGDLCDAQELRLAHRIVVGGQASATITALEAAKNTTNPDVTVATAHSTKGMQWPQVRIGSDWKAPKADDDGRVKIPRSLARLAYVAVTRAQERLDVGDAETGLGWVDNYV